MPLIDVRRAVLRDACFVAANMREQDREEIGAIVSMDNPAAVAWTLLTNSDDLAFTAHFSGQPIAVFGVARLFDHVASGWAYGTRQMRRAIPAMSRHCLGHIAPTLVRRGYRRLEVRTMASHDVSHGWLRGMGAVLETPEPYELGRHGEMFVTYGWGLKQWKTQSTARRTIARQTTASGTPIAS